MMSGPVLLSVFSGVCEGSLNPTIPVSASVCLDRMCFFDRSFVCLPRCCWLLLSGGGVSGSLSDSILYVFLSLDGDFVNRPSGPLGPVPLLLLQSWLKSLKELLIHFLSIILPFGVVTVCFVPDTAIIGLSVKALSNLDF